MATVLSDGALVEAATIGNEGIVGFEAFLSEDATASCETIVQVPARNESAEMLAVESFRNALDTCPAFHDAVARYVHVLYAVTARLTACNARHQVQERCARWLLLTHDRMRRQDFHVSHDFLAAMLGVRRPTISSVAAALQTAGFIEYVHGRVKVLNRHGLESAACECYPVIRQLFDSVK
jgi:CRP-like cAMP-binding protein